MKITQPLGNFRMTFQTLDELYLHAENNNSSRTAFSDLSGRTLSSSDFIQQLRQIAGGLTLLNQAEIKPFFLASYAFLYLKRRCVLIDIRMPKPAINVTIDVPP